MVGELRIKALSLAGDGAVEAMLAMVRCRYRVMLARMLSSHAGDGAVEVTLVVARCRC
jgi:hypothetical protein